MKLKFKIQQFQTIAVNAVCDLFKGQENKSNTFTIEHERQGNLIDNSFGIGNRLTIKDDKILENMNSIQKKLSLPITNDVENKNFCIEMETGTGKTYVYTKTIFELHKQYGFCKFIIVVPSVAIREGVYKSLEITKEHFALQYDNVPYHYFIYDSKKLNIVRNFSISTNIEIMIINIDAFKKSENIINQSQDKLNGETAMRYITDTNPIVIIDEPQSVDSTNKAKEAIASLNPLCVLRYSATHKDKINMLYRLTPVDAYQMGLVKQIVVSSNQVANDFNKPYMKLISVSHENGFSAKIEIDKATKSGKVERKMMKIKPGDELFKLSGNRELYHDYVIEGIDCLEGRECIEFGNGEMLNLGKSMGDIDENLIKKAQIRRTIEAHLNKELQYTKKGIKVLSLFFIDKVENYRYEDGSKGIYAQMFEECYSELLKLKKYETLKDKFPVQTNKIHDGYFSQDKKGNYKNTKGDTIDDYNTYNTIMKDKEWLLSFDCPLRFIFSHSALREGWDSPNVFQVCTLIEQKSTFTCRQKIGRGLRLCVDQNGERIEDKNINVLHVMANESFAEFAETLQKEIEEETGMKFGILQISLFSGMTYMEEYEQQKKVNQGEIKQLLDYFSNKGYINTKNESEEEKLNNLDSITKTEKIETKSEIKSETQLTPQLETIKKEITTSIEKGEVKTSEEITKAIENTTYTEKVQTEKTVNYDDAKELIEHFEKKGYITKTGKMKDTMKNDLLNGNLDLPKRFETAREKFETIISKADKKPYIRDGSKDVPVKLKKEILTSPEFMELWNKIKQKTTYSVNIDTEQFKKQCMIELNKLPSIPKAKIVTKTAHLQVKNPGVTYTETGLQTLDFENEENKLPDFLRMIQNKCRIPKFIVVDILFESGKAQDFLNNPQLMIEQFIETIKLVKGNMEIDGIRYKKLDGDEYYLQEIFDCDELIANIEKNAIFVKNSVFDHIIYDSNTVERPFAVALDNDPDVKMFFKIPDSFKIKTPIGNYNPDWAIYMDKNGEKQMYFVLETKGTLDKNQRRDIENQKIYCGNMHFKALENFVEFSVAKNWNEFKISN